MDGRPQQPPDSNLSLFAPESIALFASAIINSVILALALLAAAQEPDVSFRAGATDVRLDVQAAVGPRIIANLTKADFAIFDENLPQPISYFARETEPLSAVLLLDISGSMMRYLTPMADSSRQALAVLKPGDQAAIIVFDRETKVHRELGPNTSALEAELRAAIRTKGLGSGSELNKSIRVAANYLRDKAPSGVGRRAVIVVTDLGSPNYQNPDEAVIKDLTAAGAVLNAIVAGKAQRPDPVKDRFVNDDFTPADVFKLAEETGGQVLRAEKADKSAEQLQDAPLRKMMEGIRTRYTIAYKAPEARSGEFRRIRVELSEDARRRYPGAEIRVRRGYWAP